MLGLLALAGAAEAPAAYTQSNDGEVISSEGRWEFADYSGGQTLTYEIYDTFPPIMIRCLPERGTIELTFFARDPDELRDLSFERSDGNLHFSTRFEPDTAGHPFGHAVASFSTSHPIARALKEETTAPIFRTPAGRRFGFPFDTSIARVIEDCEPLP